MTGPVRKLLLWSPRVLGIWAALFLAVFALAAIGEGLSAFLLHAVPALLVLLVVAVSWRWEWVGGSVFITLAVLWVLPRWPTGTFGTWPFLARCLRQVSCFSGVGATTRSCMRTADHRLKTR